MEGAVAQRFEVVTPESIPPVWAALRNEAAHAPVPQPPTLSQSDLFRMRQEVLDLHMAEAVENYIVNLTIASRWPETYSSELAHWIEFGVSPLD